VLERDILLFKLRKEKFMCKTYDAIYKIAKNAESDVLVLWAGHKKISGTLLDCHDNKCMDEVITLKDATVECMHSDGKRVHSFRWLNIPSHHIKAFTFQCCVIDLDDLQ